VGINRPGARDLDDADFVDAAELAATGTSNFRAGTAIVSTTSATKRVVLASGAALVHGDDPIEVGDKCIISTSAAAGTYTVAAVVDDVTFDVAESIVTSTGGTAAFRFKSGALRIGVDTTGFTNSTASTLQSLLSDFDSAIGSGGNVGTNTDFLLENQPPEPDNNYTITRSGQTVTKEEWKRASGSTLIKSIDYTYSGNFVTEELIKVFAADGTTVLGRLRVTYTRSGGLVSSATRVREV
jgi:hypothetical protein